MVSVHDDAGRTQMVDENGQPVVSGPGLFEQIISKDTYSTLTQKIEDTIGDLFYGMTDAKDRKSVTTGIGGAREFDKASVTTTLKVLVLLQATPGQRGYLTTTESKFIQAAVVTQDGLLHIIRLHRWSPCERCEGSIVRSGPCSNTKHPETGLPLESYRMTFVDQSSYDGENNLQMISRKKGREMLRWCVAGSVVPKETTETDTRASDVDIASCTC